MRLLPLAVVTAVVLPSPLRPQAPPAPTDDVPRIEVQAAEVSVDFVVRDKRGRIVRDLRPNEVEVLEDGVRQEVGFFQLIAPKVAVDEAPVALSAERGAPAALPRSAPDEVEREAVVALVFDRLGTEARVNARRAADEWLKLPAVAGREVGVFRIDRGLAQLQEFTDDRATVREALEAMERSLPTAYLDASDHERLRGLRERALRLDGQGTPQSLVGSLSAADDGTAATARMEQRPADAMERDTERRFAASQIAMLEAFEELERDQQGLATTNALLSLVNGLKSLPGRKAVVLFSEGLVLPSRVLASLDSLVSEANRGGVSFYTVDAAGLRAASASDEMRRELAGLGQAAGGLPALSPASKRLERSDDLLRYDPASGLGSLARETGGFLVHDTNDITAGLRRVEEDLGAYYFLAYAPRNDAWDGRYRRIDVRVHRSGVSVHARRGYFAVRTRTPTPVLDYEAPALARLESDPSASALPLRAGALHFPAEDGESVVAIVASLPADAPAMAPETGGRDVAQDFTVLALVRDRTGRVAAKASRRYALVWPAAKAPDAAAGRVLFEREARLAPGRYTVEIVALDAQSGRAGVRRLPLDVPATRASPRVGSVVVVGQVEPRALADPGALDYRGHLLFPNLGDPVRVGGEKPIAFVVALRPGSRPVSALTVEVLSGDTLVRELPVALPPPDAAGSIRVVGEIPTAGLLPGPCTLRVVATDGEAMASRSTDLTLVP